MTTAFQNSAFQNSAFQVDSAGVSLSLAVTEGADTASGAVGLVLALALAASEGADTASGSMSVGAGALALTLDATEGADTASGVVELVALPPSMALAATEGADLCVAAMTTPNLAVTGGYRHDIWKRRRKVEDPEEEVPVAPILVPVQRRKTTVHHDPARWLPAAQRASEPVQKRPAKPVADLKTRNHNHALRLLLLAS